MDTNPSELLQLVLSLDPNEPDNVHVVHGALIAALASDELQPHDEVVARIRYSECCAILGEEVEAVEYFQSALELNQQHDLQAISAPDLESKAATLTDFLWARTAESIRDNDGKDAAIEYLVKIRDPVNQLGTALLPMSAVILADLWRGRLRMQSALRLYDAISQYEVPEPLDADHPIRDVVAYAKNRVEEARSIGAWYTRGNTAPQIATVFQLIGADRPHDAVELLSELLHDDAGSDEPEIRAVLALALYHAGDRDRSAEEVERALELDADAPESAFLDPELRHRVFSYIDWLWSRVADELRETAGEEESLQFVGDRLSLIDHVPGTHLPRVHYHAALVLLMVGRYDEAKLALEEAIAAEIPTDDVESRQWHDGLKLREHCHGTLEALKQRGKPAEPANSPVTPPQSGQQSGCWIATAACGTESIEVRILRRFRDRVLLHSQVGRLAHRIYYVTAPPIARIIATSPLLRRLVRASLVRPAARILNCLRDGQCDPCTGESSDTFAASREPSLTRRRAE
jgi:tetratricopeptide (TPR) repeat protein